MKKTLSIIYAVLCSLLLIAGCIVGFIFAMQGGTPPAALFLLGLFLSLILAPTLHELGHIVFAAANGMHLVYAKFFCFKIEEKGAKRKFGFASPFAPDETQTVPKRGGNMKKRAKAYTVGGLVFGGIFALIVIALALCFSLNGLNAYVFWGALPYSAYLFLLNVLPFEYASSKTDALVCKAIEKGYPEAQTMLNAMQIQGELYEGKTFGEIEENYYFSAPQLAEDEPLFAVMLDLRYHYYIEKGELKKAGDCLNRLIDAQTYLPLPALIKVAAEQVYFYSLCKDKPKADEASAYCSQFLRENTATSRRILATFAQAFGREEQASALVEIGKELAKTERIKGVGRFEEILLSRVKGV